MRNWRARVRLWAFACVAGVVLAGCGSDGGGDGGGSGEGAGSETGSPLSEYMGEGFRMEPGGMMVMSFGGGEMSDEDKQDMRRLEEMIATCMDERGFEYVPNAPTGDEPSEFDDAFALDPGDFAEQYGYGISTLRFAEQGDDEASDPNEKIREGLSEAAGKEYDKALWGDMATLDGGGLEGAQPMEPGTETDPEKQGCQQRAGDEVFGSPEDMGMTDMDEFQNLFDDIGALQERIDNDPRVSEAEQAWAQCMAEAGQGDFDAPADAQASVQERMQELTGGPGGESVDAPSLTTGPGTQPDIDDADLEELQSYEIDVATADFDCKQEEYQDVFDEVSHELQEEFVSQHRDELERYRESMARGQDDDAESDT